MRSLEDIRHIKYINLEHRTDRNDEVQTELRKLGLDDRAERFNAISMKDGRVGCTMSHIKCLEDAKKNQLPHLLIIEDDIQFLNPVLFSKQITNFLESNISWDVILLAGNNMPPHIQICDSAVKVTRCQTTTGYLVNGHYYDTLIKNMREGLSLLMRNPSQHFHYAVDKFWFSLQQTDKWFLITPLSVTQRAGYSDIEKRPTDFTKIMVDLDKKEFLQRMQQTRLSQRPGP